MNWLKRLFGGGTAVTVETEADRNLREASERILNGQTASDMLYRSDESVSTGEVLDAITANINTQAEAYLAALQGALLKPGTVPMQRSVEVPPVEGEGYGGKQHVLPAPRPQPLDTAPPGTAEGTVRAGGGR